MNVLQLIDSLDAGGAEQIAVHLANGFPKQGISSYLCVTRKEGILKETLENDVSFLFLNKKKTLDWNALIRLKRYVKKNNITIVHAHTMSFFFATLLKIIYPKIKLVWHTHLGARAKEANKANNYIKWCSYFFTAIITVNKDLKVWCSTHLKTKQVYYIPNGVDVPVISNQEEEREPIIVSVANLKDPKNHVMLIEAFCKVHRRYPNWKLYLIGKTFNDGYEHSVRAVIRINALENAVTIFGQQKKVFSFLKKAAIGVISSTHEGLPMALLEYGTAKLAIVSTNVGECKNVIGDAGILVPSNNPSNFAEALITYIENPIALKKNAEAFHNKITSTYTLINMIASLKDIYKKLYS